MNKPEETREVYYHRLRKSASRPAKQRHADRIILLRATLRLQPQSETCMWESTSNAANKDRQEENGGVMNTKWVGTPELYTSFGCATTNCGKD